MRQLYLVPCKAMLFKNPSTTPSASMLVEDLVQLRKHSCFGTTSFLAVDLWHITQYLFLTLIKSIFCVFKPIIVA